MRRYRENPDEEISLDWISERLEHADRWLGYTESELERGDYEYTERKDRNHMKEMGYE